MIDVFDLKILAVLQEDGKSTLSEIAEKINLSKSSTYDRIKKLEASKVITGTFAHLDHRVLGFELLAFCNISLEAHQTEVLEEFEQQVVTFQEVQSCYHIAGMYDYLILVMVENMEAYQQFLTQKLARLAKIRNVHSSFVMKVLKSNHQVPIKLPL